MASVRSTVTTIDSATGRLSALLEYGPLLFNMACRRSGTGAAAPLQCAPANRIAYGVP